MLICLDAGHGGKDPGACGAYSKEKDIALTAVLMLGSLLDELGFDIMYTRTTDTYVNLIERAKLANNAKANLFISIHCNSAADKTACGTEVLCYDVCDEANSIQTFLTSETGLKNRGIKIRKDLAVLNCTSMTAVLAELAFISNPAEEALLNNAAWLERNMTAIAKAVCKCFGIPYLIKDTAPAVTETVISINGEDKKVRRILKDGENYIRLRDLESIINISYNAADKKVSVSPK